MVVGEHSVCSRDYGRLENVGNDCESEMAKVEGKRSLEKRMLRN